MVKAVQVPIPEESASKPEAEVPVLRSIPTEDEGVVPVVHAEVSESGEMIAVPALPSNFLPYASKQLFYRGLTVGEMRKLAKSEADSSFSLVVALLKDVISGPDMLMMPPCDLKALLFLVSHQTDRDHSLNLTSECPYCETKNVSTIQIEDIEFDELKELGRKVPTVDGTDFIEFHYMKVKDMIFLEGLDMDRYDSNLAALACMMESDITSFGYPLQQFEKNIETLSALPGRYAKILADIERSLLPDMHSIDVQCRGCKNPFSVKAEIYPKELFAR